MSLSDSAVRAAKPRDKAYKLYDERGLFLTISPTGGKLWRFKYHFHDKERLLALGGYPDVGLKDAREKRDEARKLLANGKDPGTEKKRAAVAARISADNTFNVVANEFIEKIEREGLAAKTLKKTRWLAGLLEPAIGRRPVSEIEPFEVLAALKKIERRGTYDAAKRACAFASRVFRYAVITSRARSNPAADLSDALVTPKVKHHAAILNPKGVGDLLRAIDNYDGFITTALALKVSPHLFVRPGELRHMEWPEVDFEARVWRIPAAKMKMRNEHVVPLSTQAINLLAEAKLITSDAKYAFPSIRSNFSPMSDNTINAALRRLGYTSDEMTAHGFRSTASTLLNESGLWSPDAIERALAHKDGDRIRAAYHRGTHWDERVRMAQWWSDYLDKLRDGGQVLPFKAEA